MTTTPTSGAADLRAEVAMIDAAMVEMTNITPPLKRSECARLLRAALAAGQAQAAPPQPAAQQPDIENLRKALQFYADSEHFIKSDGDAWDTVSGEPQNYWCDEAGTATVEDGHIARLALSGHPVRFEDDTTPQADSRPGAAYAELPAIQSIVDDALLIKGGAKNWGGWSSTPDVCDRIVTKLQAISTKWALRNADYKAVVKQCAALAASHGQAPAVEYLRTQITGMSVSVDVSTDDATAGHRYFGTVTEVMECQGDKHGITLLVQDAEPNFKAQAAPAAVVGPADTFRGDTTRLVQNIIALLELDADGALVPHGIGGHARALLSAAASRLASAPTTQPAPQQEAQEPQEPFAWHVCSVNSDGSLSLEHAAAWEEAAHEHINDAITEHDIEGAGSWVVRPAYHAPQPSPAAQGDALDAMRYRWLRINAIGAFRTNDGKGPVSVYHLSKIPAIPGIPEETDAAIDAARAAQEGKP